MDSTSLCKLLNIRYPIIQTEMSGFTTPEQVAAVSNALEYFEPLVCHLNRQMMLLGRLRSLLPILLLLAPP